MNVCHRFLMLVFTAALFQLHEVSAQGNLQFNQVIAQANLSSNCYVVPAGKVFKLEAMTWPNAGASQVVYFGTTCGASDRGVMRTAAYNLFAGPSASGNFGIWPFPQWYPAGTFINATDNSISINGIEFNIIP
jgi:hypothetical protein